MKVLILLLLIVSCWSFDILRNGCEHEISIGHDRYNISDIYEVNDAYPTDAHYDEFGNLFYVESGRNDDGFYFNIKVISAMSDFAESVEGLPDGLGYSIAIDRKAQEVYFGTGKGLYKYNYDTNNAEIISRSLKINMMFIDRDSNKYVTENYNGVEEVYLLDGEKKIRFRALEALNEVAIDENNNFFFIKEAQVFVLQNTDSRPKRIGKVNYDGLAQISFYKENVYIASQDLKYLNSTESSFNLKSIENIPDKVTSIAFNKNGNFVVGVYGKLLKYVRNNECYIRRNI